MSVSFSALQSMRTAMIKVLKPYLLEPSPAVAADDQHPYICLKVRKEAFTTKNVPKNLGGEKGSVWHVHIEQDGVTDLGDMVRWLQPELQKAAAPAVFRWKLEGGD